MKNILIIVLLGSLLISCTTPQNEELEVAIYQTSSSGDKLNLIEPGSNLSDCTAIIALYPEKNHQCYW